MSVLCFYLCVTCKPLCNSLGDITGFMGSISLSIIFMNVYIQDGLEQWANWSASLIQDMSEGCAPHDIGDQSKSLFLSRLLIGIILYMELSSFLFCKMMEDVNLYVCKS